MEENLKKIDYTELMPMIEKAITDKWRKQFPKDFDCCKEVPVENAKSFAYSVYIGILNNLERLYYAHPNYKVNDVWKYKISEEFQALEQRKLLEDIKNCDNIKIWCVDNIGI